MRAVVFDLGKVLVRYDPEEMLRVVAGFCSGDIDTVREAMSSVASDLNTGAISGDDLLAHLCERAGFRGDRDAFSAAYCAVMARDEEGLAFATSLPGRWDTRVGVISNTNIEHAGWLYANLPEFARFDAVILSHEHGLAKPDVAVFQLALDRLGVTPEQAIFIDDSIRHVAAARALGMTGIVHTDWRITAPAIERWLEEDTHGRR